ncbi:MAG: zinc ABC transporter substrate-binding protein [Planctomycetota bacterium]
MTKPLDSVRRVHASVVVLAVCLPLAGASLLGCTGAGPTTSSDSSAGQLRVVATTGMVADLVREIGADLVSVQQLMGPGVDPHLYKATRDDVAAISAADAVFYSGLLLEGKMTDTLKKVGRNKPVHAVTELIDEGALIEPEDAGGHADPHVWMDLTAWRQCVDAVRDSLVESLPDQAGTLAENAERYRAELTELDAYARQTLATIPPGQRVLLTSHDAFNYFGRAYELEVIGVQGLSTESEAGLQRINTLVDLLVERQVPAVFVESSVSSKNIRALVDGAAARGHEVRIGGELFSDAMGQAGTYEGTYVGMLDHNVTTVARALGGQAPERGLRGRLGAGPLETAEADPEPAE